MNWIEIKDVSPNSARKVLLSVIDKGIPHYAIGELGGCKNNPEIVCDSYGDKKIVRATHWCELEPPTKNKRT